MSFWALFALLLARSVSVDAQGYRPATLPPRLGGDGDGDCKTFNARGVCICNAFEHISCLPSGFDSFKNYSDELAANCNGNCSTTCTYYIDTLFVHYAECPLHKLLHSYTIFDRSQRACMNSRRWTSLYTLGLVVGACTPMVSLTKEEGWAAAATVTGLFVFLLFLLLVLSCAIGKLFQFRAQIKRRIEMNGMQRITPPSGPQR